MSRAPASRVSPLAARRNAAQGVCGPAPKAPRAEMMTRIAALARRRLAAARRADGERGMVMVVTAIFLVVIVGMAALVIDLAQLREDRAYNRKSADLVATPEATTLATHNGTLASASQHTKPYDH